MRGEIALSNAKIEYEPQFPEAVIDFNFVVEDIFLAIPFSCFTPAPQPRFSAGDVVRLKSGGPRMTVTDTSEGDALCSYFNADDDHSHASVPFAALEHAAD